MEAPVFGSASAATSATVRRMHSVSFCQLGFGSWALQPLPAPLQAVSLLYGAIAIQVEGGSTDGSHVLRSCGVFHTVPAITVGHGNLSTDLAEMAIIVGLA